MPYLHVEVGEGGDERVPSAFSDAADLIARYLGFPIVGITVAHVVAPGPGVAALADNAADAARGTCARVRGRCGDGERGKGQYNRMTKMSETE